MAFGHFKWDQQELISEKTGYKKSRETVPLTLANPKICVKHEGLTKDRK